MKKISGALVGLAAVAVGGLGLWVGTRHRPAGSLLDEPLPAFSVDSQASGWRIGYTDAQTPLRSLHWLQPRQAGWLVAQVQTQSDRQQVAVFREGAMVADFALNRPQGVHEGFWRFAQLADAQVLPDSSVLLLYRASTPGEAALAMVVEPGASEPRWLHRGAYTRMAVAADQAVFLYGGATPVLRLPLAGGPRRPVAKEIPLPAEAPAVDDLLATGAWTFLAATPKGLSVYQGAQKGWVHYPAPDGPVLAVADWHASLVQAGRRIWWQPAPGRLVQVAPDGALVADREVSGFDEDDPFARDAKLLRLEGADPMGRLWFSLARPLPAPAPADGAAPAEDWTAYLAQGLGRAYGFDPDKERLERVVWNQAWSLLKPPAEVDPQAPSLRPAADAVLLAGQRSCWWLPLEALPTVQAR